MKNENILFKKQGISNKLDKNISCKILDPNVSGNTSKIAEIKRIFVGSLQEIGIGGFSYEIDKVFDSYSLYFIAEDENEIVSFLRMVFKSPLNKLPIETGYIIDTNAFHVINEHKSVELTTFWCKDFLSLEPLARMSFEYLYKAGIKNVYSTKEVGEKKIGSIYRRLGLKPSDSLKKIYYPTYGRVDKEGSFIPIVWQIYEGDKERINFIAKKFKC